MFTFVDKIHSLPKIANLDKRRICTSDASLFGQRTLNKLLLDKLHNARNIQHTNKASLEYFRIFVFLTELVHHLIFYGILFATYTCSILKISTITRIFQLLWIFYS